VLFHLPYRQEEGFVKVLSKHVEGLKPPDWSTIWARTSSLDVDLQRVRTDLPISIAIDSSGIKVTNSGDWIRKKWGVRKGYLKVHLAVDPKSKEAVSMRITEENVGDNSQLKPLVEAAKAKNNDLDPVS
jgi:IS5 family transposase